MDCFRKKTSNQFLFIATSQGCQTSWVSRCTCKVSRNPTEISRRPDLHSLKLAENSPLLGSIQMQALFPLSCDISITKTTLLFVQRAAKNREIAQFKKKKKGMCFQKQFCTSSKTKGCAWTCAVITLIWIISCPDFAPQKAEISSW